MALSWNRVHLIAAREAHRDLHSNLKERIDPFAALAYAGVVVFRRSLGRLAGAYIAANPSDGSAPGVLIHAGHPLSKQRYTAAHELCHHRRDHATIFDEDTEWLTRGDDRQSDRERIAEAFAAWFLMPPALVTQVITQQGLRTSGEDLCEEFLHWGAKQRDGLAPYGGGHNAGSRSKNAGRPWSTSRASLAV